MARLRPDFQQGKLDLDTGGITATQTNFDSNQFPNLPTVASPDYLVLVLDPYGVHGAPERITVTSHGAAATAIQASRGTDGALTGLPTRAHNQNGVIEDWIVGITDQDFVHGNLSALNADDHPQYYNSARHAASGAHSALAVLNDLYEPGAVRGTRASIVPAGWLLCDGSSYNIADYEALYNALGGANSPDGVNTAAGTFQVPDYRGRTPIGAGTGTGLTARSLGSKGGEETHLLVNAEMPVHSHASGGHGHGNTSNQSANHSHGVNAAGGANNGWIVAGNTASANATVSNGNGDRMNPINPGSMSTAANNGAHYHIVGTGYEAIQNAGGGTPHNVMQPWYAHNWIIKT